MFSHVSRRKQALSAAASAADRGGISRVLLIPDCGALVITASAHKFDSYLDARGSRIEYEPFNLGILSQKGSLFLTRPTLGDYIATRAELLERAGEVLGWIKSGKLKLRIDHEFPLAQAAEAHRALEGRKTTGKVLLIP